MNLKNHVLVVTGASSGIGRETALAAGKLGAAIVLTARRKDRLEEVAAQIEKAGSKVLVVAADISQESDVEKLIHATQKEFGRIDVLINNAGAGLYATVSETTGDQMERIWRTNFMGTFYAIQKSLPIMKKQGSGHIITICSMAGKRATPFGAAYSATKFAQSGFMESLRMELKNSPIRTTVVYPGATESDFFLVIENPGSREIKHALKAQSASQVAKAILDTIRNPKPEVILQPFGRILSVLNSANPGFVDWVVGNFFKKKQLKEE